MTSWSVKKWVWPFSFGITWKVARKESNRRHEEIGSVRNSTKCYKCRLCRCCQPKTLSITSGSRRRGYLSNSCGEYGLTLKSKVDDEVNIFSNLALINRCKKYDEFRAFRKPRLNKICTRLDFDSPWLHSMRVKYNPKWRAPCQGNASYSTWAACRHITRLQALDMVVKNKIRIRANSHTVTSTENTVFLHPVIVSWAFLKLSSNFLPGSGYCSSFVASSYQWRNLKHLHIKFEVPPSVDFSLNTALESFRLEHAITFSKNSNLNAPGSFWHFRILSILPEVLSHIRSQSLQVLALGVSGRLRYDPFPAQVQELASALQLPSFGPLHRLNFHDPWGPYTSDSGLVDTFSTTILEKLPVAVTSCANFTDALE
ncbi:hypothetical protein C8R43DRAFT_1112135 [Mycena crocata]|nr:hypothetical protein C8R43DRAFT_1112135 [Mycena crocata]